MNASEEHTRLLLETKSIMVSTMGWLSGAAVKDFPYILHCLISDVWVTLTLTLTFVVKLFTPHVNCITLHWALSTVSTKHKLHTCHWTWLWNMNHTTPIPVQKPLPQHVHPWQTGKERIQFMVGIKKIQYLSSDTSEFSVTCKF